MPSASSLRLDAFKGFANKKGEKYLFVYAHFKDFTKGKCTFGDLNVAFCKKFSEYLQNQARGLRLGHKLCANTAASYWSHFRAFLKKAYLDKYLNRLVTTRNQIATNYNTRLTGGLRENDNLTSLMTISDFARRTGALLVVMSNGKHWFHTPEQMAFPDAYVAKATMLTSSKAANNIWSLDSIP